MTKYFRAKADWYVQTKLESIEVTTREVEEGLFY